MSFPRFTEYSRISWNLLRHFNRAQNYTYDIHHVHLLPGASYPANFRITRRPFATPHVSRSSRNSLDENRFAEESERLDYALRCLYSKQKPRARDKSCRPITIDSFREPEYIAKESRLVCERGFSHSNSRDGYAFLGSPGLTSTQFLRRSRRICRMGASAMVILCLSLKMDE